MQVALFVRRECRVCRRRRNPRRNSVDPWVGGTLDRFRVDAVLGDGGMARVYRARHQYLGHEVALKILYGEHVSGEGSIQRFQREAIVADKIRHENVVSVVDFGISGRLCFMAMELVRGETLSSLLVRRGPFEPELVAFFARQICAGLMAAHELGFVHRNLKPSNVMALEIGNDSDYRPAKILDFGLVRVTSVEAAKLTLTGQVFGTPLYMAPEQIVSGPTDARTDLYALGATMFELLTGKPVFEGAFGQILAQHVSTAPPKLRARDPVRDERRDIARAAVRERRSVRGRRDGRRSDRLHRADHERSDRLCLAAFGRTDDSDAGARRSGDGSSFTPGKNAAKKPFVVALARGRQLSARRGGARSGAFIAVFGLTLASLRASSLKRCVAQPQRSPWR